MKLRKDDMVVVIKGKDKGKKGKVLRLFPEKNTVIVEGVNKITRHMRPNRENPKGGILQLEAPIRVPNLMLICPKTNKPSRIGYMILSDGTKQRIAKKSKEMI